MANRLKAIVVFLTQSSSRISGNSALRAHESYGPEEKITLILIIIIIINLDFIV